MKVLKLILSIIIFLSALNLSAEYISLSQHSISCEKYWGKSEEGAIIKFSWKRIYEDNVFNVNDTIDKEDFTKWMFSDMNGDIIELGINITNKNRYKINTALLRVKEIRNDYYYPIQYIQSAFFEIKNNENCDIMGDWANIRLGDLTQHRLFKNDKLFYGFYGGAAISSIKLKSELKDFKNREFHGLSPILGWMLVWEKNDFKLNLNAEAKAIIWNKTLFTINPEANFEINVSNLFSKVKNPDNGFKLIIGYETKAFYEYNSSAKDISNKYFLGLNYLFE